MVDNRIRERLTGAAILVAVIVLLVPELLSRPRHPRLQQAAAIDEAPIRSYRLSLGDSQQSASPVTPVTPATASAPAATAPAATASAAAAPVASPAAASAPEARSPAVTSGSVEAGGSAPKIARARQAAGSHEAAGSHKAAGLEKAAGSHKAAGPRKAAGPQRAVRAEHAPGGWAVQVGSFGSRENADRLVRSLKLKGYAAFITESSSRGRKWYRVRVGPERNRAAADAIAARLRAAGIRGAVAQAR